MFKMSKYEKWGKFYRNYQLERLIKNIKLKIPLGHFAI